MSGFIGRQSLAKAAGLGAGVVEGRRGGARAAAAKAAKKKNLLLARLVANVGFLQDEDMKST
jgi:hypothetical protein